MWPGASLRRGDGARWGPGVVGAMRPRTSSSCARSSCARPAWSPSAWSLSTWPSTSQRSSSKSMPSSSSASAWRAPSRSVSSPREPRLLRERSCSTRPGPCRPRSGHPSPWRTCRRRCAPWRPSRWAALPVCFVTRPAVWTCTPPSAALNLIVSRDLRRAAAFGWIAPTLAARSRAERASMSAVVVGLGVRAGGGGQGLRDVRLRGASTRGEHLAAASRLPDALET